MYAWEYELFISKLNEEIKKENDENDKNMKKYDITKNHNKQIKNYSPNNFKMPKIPNMPSIH